MGFGNVGDSGGNIIAQQGHTHCGKADDTADKKSADERPLRSFGHALKGVSKMEADCRENKPGKQGKEAVGAGEDETAHKITEPAAVFKIQIGVIQKRVCGQHADGNEKHVDGRKSQFSEQRIQEEEGPDEGINIAAQKIGDKERDILGFVQTGQQNSWDTEAGNVQKNIQPKK